MIKTITTYKELKSQESLKLRFRTPLRNVAVNALSVFKDMNKASNGVYFPYYHHVFKDEVEHFKRQMKFLRNYGDFISIDDAIALFQSNASINERYFSISFDDGFSSCYEYMIDITHKMSIPVLIYLPTNYIGLNYNEEKDYKKGLSFNPKLSKCIPFLTWEQCSEMLDMGVTFGSHTMNHINLLDTNDEDLRIELVGSKKSIEKNLGTECKHFAPPWGKLGVNFSSEQVEKIIKKVGFASVVTTHRGVNEHNTSPYLIKRDHVLATWSNAQLKYLFGG
jgi:peptidoglycan/xylan/chitin deacetylase (PgdA/CDA1 family)